VLVVTFLSAWVQEYPLKYHSGSRSVAISFATIILVSRTTSMRRPLSIYHFTIEADQSCAQCHTPGIEVLPLQREVLLKTLDFYLILINWLAFQDGPTHVKLVWLYTPCGRCSCCCHQGTFLIFAFFVRRRFFVLVPTRNYGILGSILQAKM
jgi:hypothetical protein